MKIINYEIYQLANNILSNNIQNLDIHIPAKANFFIQKNIKIIVAAAQEIEETRLAIAKHYGTKDETTDNYILNDKNAAAASQELSELLSIEQDLDIKTFSIEDLGNAEFTPAQMQSIMFMIED